MSTILKALRRVEEEHGAGPGAPRRALRGDLVRGSAPPPRRRRPRGPNWKLWGSLGAALLLAALVWWRLPRPGTEIVQAVPPAAQQALPPATEPSTPAPAAAPAAAPTPEPAAPPAAVAAAAPEAAPPAPGPAAGTVPAEVAERLPPLGAPLEAPPAQVAAEAAVAAPAPPSEPAQAPEPAAAEPAPAPKPSRVAAAPKPAPAAKPVSKPVAKPAPSAPSIEVERTSWHPRPERRVAWVHVEGLAGTREVHEGDGIGTLVVREIRPSAVVFQHGGEQIQRRVGER